MKGTNSNAVSLAGEFAVLSQLAIRGYDANMTLGHTKGVDILVSNPATGKMLKVEVKTNYHRSPRAGSNSKLFGKFTSAWLLNKKNEEISDPNLFYCFVNISEDIKHFRFYIVPSKVVADYVRKEHKLWLDDDKKHNETVMRQFRLGQSGEKYRIPTPIDKDYEDNWEFRIKNRRSHETFRKD